MKYEDLTKKELIYLIETYGLNHCFSDDEWIREICMKRLETVQDGLKDIAMKSYELIGQLAELTNSENWNETEDCLNKFVELKKKYSEITKKEKKLNSQRKKLEKEIFNK